MVLKYAFLFQTLLECHIYHIEGTICENFVVKYPKITCLAQCDIHSPKGLLGTPAQFLINAII